MNQDQQEGKIGKYVIRQEKHIKNEKIKKAKC
jgi:hypothetical protein